jgi:TolB-like protein
MAGFFGELKRRNVVRVGIAYVVAAWLVIQVAETLLPAFGAPEWVFRSLVILIALGFPFALLFAWAFEVTPAGIKKTVTVDRSASLTHSTGRKLDFVIIATLVVALGYFLWERQGLIEASREAAPVATAGTTGAERPARSIAVLPFVNMSSDNEQEWFADGLTEELLNSLVRTPDLRVASRTSSFTYKNSDKPVQTIAEEMGVAHILEGSVRRGGDRVRVTAQLIRAEDGFHLWSQTYDNKLEDVIEIQEKVSIAIARALEVAMDPDALADMMSAGTHSVPAYEAYLEGLAYFMGLQRSGDIYDELKALEAFQRAVELDPQFARAWARLGLFWTVQLNTINIASGITGLSEAEMLEHQKAAYEKALEFEKDPVNVLFYQAEIATAASDYRAANRYLNEYLEHRPHDWEAQVTRIIILGSARHYDEAVELSLAYLDGNIRERDLASSALQVLRYAKDSQVIRDSVQRILEHHGDATGVLYQAHRALLFAGDIDGASRLVQPLQNSNLPMSSRFLVNLRQACGENRVGDAQQLMARYRETRELPIEEEFSIEWLALEILGDHEAATTLLRALDNPDRVGELIDYSSYGHFDIREYPYLASQLAGQDVRVDDVRELPYRCKL